MLQIRFLQALLRRCKQDLGLHTAVDTSGFLGARASEDFLDLVDLFLLDIKAGDEQLYHLVTSAELAPTLRFARRLSDRGNPMWVRYVLVPGLTDAAERRREGSPVHQHAGPRGAGGGAALPPAGRGQVGRPAAPVPAGGRAARLT